MSDRAAFRPRPRPAEEDESWISVSDLMSGLMVVFLFVAISYLRPAVEARNRAQEAHARSTRAQATLRDIVVAFRDAEARLAARLEEAFRGDLPRWGAELDRASLTLRFRAPDVLFDLGQARLRPAFRDVLQDLLPRCTATLHDFREAIE